MLLKRLMDEVKYEQKHGAEDDKESAGSGGEGEESSDTGLDLPAAPSKALPEALEDTSTSKGDEDLASRFASLSLPSVPSTLKPPTKSKGSAPNLQTRRSTHGASFATMTPISAVLDVTKISTAPIAGSRVTEGRTRVMKKRHIKQCNTSKVAERRNKRIGGS